MAAITRWARRAASNAPAAAARPAAAGATLLDRRDHLAQFGGRADDPTLTVALATLRPAARVAHVERAGERHRAEATSRSTGSR
jgi:hypothetical protein